LRIFIIKFFSHSKKYLGLFWWQLASHHDLYLSPYTIFGTLLTSKGWKKYVWTNVFLDKQNFLDFSRASKFSKKIVFIWKFQHTLFRFEKKISNLLARPLWAHAQQLTFLLPPSGAAVIVKGFFLPTFCLVLSIIEKDKFFTPLKITSLWHPVIEALKHQLFSLLLPSYKKLFLKTTKKKLWWTCIFPPCVAKRWTNFCQRACVWNKNWWETSTHFLNQYVNMNCDNVLKKHDFLPLPFKKNENWWCFAQLKKPLYSLFVTPKKSCQNFSNLSLIWSMLYSFIFFCAMTPIDFFLKCVRLWLFFLWKHMLY